MNISLADKVLLVTGGSEGIGKEIARKAADAGARVAILSRDEEEMQSAVDEIEASGAEAMWVAADVSREEEVERAINLVVDRWGQLHILVANAGTNGTWTPIDEMIPSEWRSTIEVNLTGYHRLTGVDRRGPVTATTPFPATRT